LASAGITDSSREAPVLHNLSPPSPLNASLFHVKHCHYNARASADKTIRGSGGRATGKIQRFELREG
jgi:hypothetical protein